MARHSLRDDFAVTVGVAGVSVYPGEKGCARNSNGPTKAADREVLSVSQSIGFALTDVEPVLDVGYRKVFCVVKLSVHVCTSKKYFGKQKTLCRLSPYTVSSDMTQVHNEYMFLTLARDRKRGYTIPAVRSNSVVRAVMAPAQVYWGVQPRYTAVLFCFLQVV